jgi:hypothetical protein
MNQQTTWYRARLDSADFILNTVRFWVLSLFWAFFLSVTAVTYYPQDSSQMTKAFVQAAFLLVGFLVLFLAILLFNVLFWAPRKQRDDAWRQIRRMTIARQWRALLDEITRWIEEGQAILAEYGRPSMLDSKEGLTATSSWIARVGSGLPSEYRADFVTDGRAVFQGDGVWVRQLDGRVIRLRGIAADIRKNYLRTEAS